MDCIQFGHSHRRFASTDRWGRSTAPRLRSPVPLHPGRALTRAIGEGRLEWSGQFEDYHKDGTRISIDAYVARINDASGRPVGIMGVSQDITDKKLSEEALQASDARFRQPTASAKCSGSPIRARAK